VVTIRDATAYAEMSHAPLCILSLDFTKAFYRIAHRYLFRLLKEYGFNIKLTPLREYVSPRALLDPH